MKKISIAFLSLTLALGLSACKCGVEKQAISEMETSHEIVSKELLKYVGKDPSLNAAAKDDWKKLVESDKRNMEKLKKAVE